MKYMLIEVMEREISEPEYFDTHDAWNDFPVDCKRGSACYKTKVKETAPLLNDKGDTEMVEVVRNRWVIDREPPIFSQERGYVEKWI